MAIFNIWTVYIFVTVLWNFIFWTRLKEVLIGVWHLLPIACVSGGCSGSPFCNSLCVQNTTYINFEQAHFKPINFQTIKFSVTNQTDHSFLSLFIYFPCGFGSSPLWEVTSFKSSHKKISEPAMANLDSSLYIVLASPISSFILRFENTPTRSTCPQASNSMQLYILTNCIFVHLLTLRFHSLFNLYICGRLKEE